MSDTFDMTHSPEFAAAFVQAQSKMDVAVKDAQNPHLKNKYADLTAVLDVVLPALNECGIGLIQRAVETDKPFTLRLQTILLHKSGQSMVSYTEMPIKQNDAQAIGSALTYARRYAVSALCGVRAEDDDGNGAVAQPPQQSQPSNQQHNQQQRGQQPVRNNNQQNQQNQQPSRPQQAPQQAPAPVPQQPVEEQPAPATPENPLKSARLAFIQEGKRLHLLPQVADLESTTKLFKDVCAAEFVPGESDDISTWSTATSSLKQYALNNPSKRIKSAMEAGN